MRAVDIITGGFPCQDISVAGHRKGTGTRDNPTDRSGLWFEQLRVIGEMRPRWAIIENVYQLLLGGDGDTVLSGMEAEGYTCWPIVVAAEDLGVPHERKRAWIVCRRNDADGLCGPEELMAGDWPIPSDCRRRLAEARLVWDWLKQELSGAPEHCFQPKVCTLTAKEVTEKNWSDRWVRRSNGRWRKLHGSMSWAQELAVRAAVQNNPSLEPTAELAEQSMGFTVGWTDLGTVSPKVARYVRLTQGFRSAPKWEERLEALGNAVVPQIPMMIGSFIREYESRAAALRRSPAHPAAMLPAQIVRLAGTSEFKEVTMSNDVPSFDQNGQPAGSAASEPEGAPCESAVPQEAGGARSGVVADAEAYLRSYLSFPDGKYFLPLGLFAALLHCWEECFDEVPYLSVSASTKSAGKTRLLELLSFLAGEDRAVLVDGSVTEAALYAEIAEGKAVLIDESEKLRTPRSPFRPILNGGYRRGQHVYRRAGGHNEKFPTFCPKAFSHIGDVFDSLRDRCILVRMQRTMGGGRKEFCRAEAQEEGNAIGRRLKEAVSSRLDEIREAYRHYHERYPSLGFLRDREIWKPLFGLCQALAPDLVPALERSAADIAALKTVPARPFESLAEEEKESEEMEYAGRLLGDAVSVMASAGTDKMATGELARLLREMPTSPWRTFRGSGITGDGSGAMLMASMLRRFGVEPRTLRVRPKGEPGSTAKGYRLADLMSGAERAGLSVDAAGGRNPVTPAAASTPSGAEPGVNGRRDTAPGGEGRPASAEGAERTMAEMPAVEAIPASFAATP